MEDYVLITGASSGVGREIAIALSQNHFVILNGRNEERLLETKERCSNSERVLIWQYDLNHVDDIETAFRNWLNEKEICVSAFVHCAGVMKMLPCKVISARYFEETYHVNVISAALIIKTLSSKKINKKHLKSVVFISSNISNRGARAFSVYGSSKAALDGLMRNLAVELAPDIRVNSILPGGMITEMTKDMFEDDTMLDEFRKSYPLGIGFPSQITPMVDFLISDKSNWITGQQFVIDGGRTIDITERA